jgi:hypothetical protein
MLVRPFQLDAVEHHHRQAHITEIAAHQLGERFAGALTNDRDTVDFDVDRALDSTSSPTGSCVRG